MSDRGATPARERVGHATHGLAWEEPLLFERSRPGRVGYSLPAPDVPARRPGGAARRRARCATTCPSLPELSEVDVVRHFTRLSTWNAAVDLGLYPLGSCTMKYNPKINERAARLPGFARAHPLQPAAHVAGPARADAGDSSGRSPRSRGMDRVTLQPAAGAQGELAGIMMIRAYHEHRGEQRTQGAGPRLGARHEPRERRAERLPGRDDPVGRATACCTRTPSPRRWTTEVAALMITNPNTLGLFERAHRDDLRDRPRAAAASSTATAPT